jgi:hypothetical protein
VVAGLFGYFLMRQLQPERISPFRMPGWFRWVALAAALFLTYVYFVGGWAAPKIVVAPTEGHFLYILGIIIVATYLPLYFWRKLSDKRLGIPAADAVPVVVGTPGVIGLDSAPEPSVQLEPEG